MTKFSIIATDYEFHTPRDDMRRGLKSIADQTFKDYELIIVHDGPKKISYENEIDLSIFDKSPKIINTPKRINDYSHSSKDLGMKIASGDYILHFNINNLLYSNCLEKISNKINKTKSPIIIFAIYHHKINGYNSPFTGLPPILYKIDALQLVAQRKIWQEIGYWYDKSNESDGKIYQDMCLKYPWTHINEILAENF